LEGEREIERLRSDERPRSPSQQHGSQLLPLADPAGQREDIPERRPELDFVDARDGDVAGQAEQPGSRRARRPDPGEGGPADAQLAGTRPARTRTPAPRQWRTPPR